MCHPLRSPVTRLRMFYWTHDDALSVTPYESYDSRDYQQAKLLPLLPPLHLPKSPRWTYPLLLIVGATRSWQFVWRCNCLRAMTRNHNFFHCCCHHSIRLQVAPFRMLRMTNLSWNGNDCDGAYLLERTMLCDHHHETTVCFPSVQSFPVLQQRHTIRHTIRGRAFAPKISLLLTKAAGKATRTLAAKMERERGEKSGQNRFEKASNAPLFYHLFVDESQNVANWNSLWS